MDQVKISLIHKIYLKENAESVIICVEKKIVDVQSSKTREGQKDNVI